MIRISRCLIESRSDMLIQSSQYEDTLRSTVTIETTVNRRQWLTGRQQTTSMPLDQAARVARIWDILKDTEEPIAHEKLTSKTGRSAATVVATLEPC